MQRSFTVKFFKNFYLSFYNTLSFNSFYNTLSFNSFCNTISFNSFYNTLSFNSFYNTLSFILLLVIVLRLSMYKGCSSVFLLLLCKVAYIFLLRPSCRIFYDFRSKSRFKDLFCFVIIFVIILLLLFCFFTIDEIYFPEFVFMKPAKSSFAYSYLRFIVTK